MLPLSRCRAILGTDCDLSDEELQSLREELYALAWVLTDHIAASNSVEVDKTSQLDDGTEMSPKNLSETLVLIPKIERDAIEERAAIREFEGEMPRDEAERAAIADHLLSKLN